MMIRRRRRKRRKRKGITKSDPLPVSRLAFKTVVSKTGVDRELYSISWHKP